MTHGTLGLSHPKPVAFRTALVVALGVAGALGLLSFTQGAAQAQAVCMSHDELARRLHERFQEVQVANAISNNGALVELYATADNSSWTLAMTRPGEVSCVLVAGESWNYFPTFWREQMVESTERENTP